MKTLCQVMHPDAVYVHPFERGGDAQQQQHQEQIRASSRPQTSHGFTPNDTDWKLLALAATRSKQQQQQHQHHHQPQSVSATNLALQRSSSALNPLSNSRDIENTLTAAAAAAGMDSAAALQHSSSQRHNTPRVAAGWTMAELCHIKARHCHRDLTFGAWHVTRAQGNMTRSSGHNPVVSEELLLRCGQVW